MSALPVQASSEHGIVAIYDDPRVSQIIPHAKRVVKNGKPFLLIPHKPSEMQVLKNLGYAPPSSLEYQYDWGGIATIFDHQKEAVELLVANRRCYLLLDMGLGKSLSVLLAYDYLRKAGEVNKLLVVAPLSTVDTVWAHEVFKWVPHYKTAVVHGTRQQRLDYLNTDADIFIINPDGVHIVDEVLAARSDIDIITVDELTDYRNVRTRRWKALNKVVSNRRFVWGLTGSPMANSPLDAYGQVKLLTPSNVPKYFGQFRNQTMQQLTQFKWIPKPEAADIVAEAMQPSMQRSKEECLDLPPTSYITHQVPLTADQQAIYKELKTKMYAMFDNKEVTAVNAGVQMGKLLQVSAGAVYAGNELVMQLDMQPRIDTIVNLIKSTTGKVIVFGAYRNVVDRLRGELDHHFKCATVNGGVSKTERGKIFNLFQNSATPRVIVAVPSAMSHGLTLTAADTIIWATPVHSLETYQQANARIVRPGQTRNTTIIHLESTPLERRIFDKLEKRQKLQTAVLDLLRDEVYGD